MIFTFSFLLVYEYFIIVNSISFRKNSATCLVPNSHMGMERGRPKWTALVGEELYAVFYYLFRNSSIDLKNKLMMTNPPAGSFNLGKDLRNFVLNYI